MTSLGDSLFNGCTSLTAVYVPSTVTSIGSSCFPNQVTTWYSQNNSAAMAYGFEQGYTCYHATTATGTQSSLPEFIGGYGEFYPATPSTGTTSPSTGTTTPSTGKTTPSTGTTTPSTGTTTTTPSTGTTTPSTGTTHVIPTVSQGSPLNQGWIVSNNSNRHNYGLTLYKAVAENSYLAETSSGYTRIECISGEDGITIEQYNDNFELTAVSSVPKELSNFTAFHEGAEHYYLMFYESNTESSKTKEVVRVVEYDKYWERLGSVSYSNINTYNNVTTADMVEHNGNLLIHSCHTMFDIGDGYNHQANMSFVIDIASMTAVNTAYGVSNYTTGYVSHSFQQYIDVSSDGFLVTVDHGDAKPRGITAFSWPGDTIYNTTSGTNTLQSVTMFSFADVDDLNYNYTKASLGGTEVGSSAVIVAGHSINQNTSTYTNKQDYNIFVSTTPKNNFTESATTTTWFTNYTGDSYASNPHLVQVTEDKFILLWNEFPIEVGVYGAKLFYAQLDGSGKQVGATKSTSGKLSEVVPLVNSDGSLVWYTTTESAPVFYSLNLNTGVCTGTATGRADVSLDGASSWATGFITEANQLGLLSGMDDITSKYQNDITREEFCRLIMNVYRSTGKTSPTGNNPFSDTSNADVISANQLGIVNGKSADIFAPNDKITRQELAVMVQRTAEHFQTISGLSTTTSFSDDSTIDSWAKEAVFYAEREGFLAGSNGKILPHDNLTCEQAIVI